KGAALAKGAGGNRRLERGHGAAWMKTTPHWGPFSVEADIRERAASGPAVDPVREDALIGPAKLSGPRQHATSVDPDREPERAPVFQRQLLRSELRRSVER